ncbi:MAG: hypothetical protein ACQESO_05035 [Bacillota bacterium]
MKNNKFKTLTIVFLLALFIVLAGVGCDPEPGVIEDIVEDRLNGLPADDSDLPDPVEEPAGTPSTYYWPWVSHGHLDFSTGEVIPGPDLFESERGFIAEFTEEYSYKGLLVWLVTESDVFALEWVNLSFSVDYFEDSEWAAEMAFDFEIDNLQPEPGDEGLQEFAVNLIDHQQGFVVAVNKILLGKEQESSFSAGLINYVALEVEMKVVGNP